jgi:hypothetical protein
MIDHQRDMTPVVDLTRKKGTGAVRTRRPIYVDLLPPCNNACPVGGMQHFGIPAYRLPRADLMAEIKRIEAFGVKIVLNSKVQDVLEAKAAGKFDAFLWRSARIWQSMSTYRRATPPRCSMR